MKEILRDEYNFNGFIVSDWMDIERIHTLHKVAKNLKDASYYSIDAGMDMHMHGGKYLSQRSQIQGRSGRLEKIMRKAKKIKNHI